MKNDRVEQLLRDAEKTNSAALKAGLKAAADEAQKAQEKKVLADYNRLRAAVNAQVRSLKEYRKAERDCSKKVAAADAALVQFMADGDFDKASKAMSEADVYIPRIA